MKKYITICFLFLIHIAMAQQIPKHEYTYDNAGNRVNRKMIYVNPSPPPEKTDSVNAIVEIMFAEELSIKAYPNPTRISVVLESSKSDSEVDEIKKFDERGLLILDASAVSLPYEISMTNFTAGKYILWLKIGVKIERIPVLKI